MRRTPYTEAEKAIHRERDRLRKRAAREAAGAPARPIGKKSAKATPVIDRPPTDERETVAEWMARTGRTPQVLPLGYVSNPLTFGGHRDFNDKSMRRALAEA